jgi:uncharacterized damage-inducible protein DinB
MQPASYEDTFAHMEWADALVWGVTLRIEGGAEDEHLQSTMAHLHLVQRGFLGLWCSTLDSAVEELLDPNVDPEGLASATERRDWARRYYPWARKLLAELEPGDLDRVVQIPWAGRIEERIGRPPMHVTLRETLYQVVAHSMHHRGQVNRRIRELGGEPPLTDYIAWLWMGRPDPAW